MSDDIDDTSPVDDLSQYANVFSFMGLPLTRQLDAEVDAVIMGVPYDLATSARPGARSGPTGIRQASANLRWEARRWPWDFALDDELYVVDYGDIRFTFGDSEDMLAQVEAHARHIAAAGKTLVTLGGDHFVTLPLLRGHAATYGPMALIHFDAHTDTAPEDEDGPYNHGSMFSRAPEEGLIDPAYSVQVGIRTEYARDGHPFLVLDADRVNELSVEAVVAAIRERVGEAPAYLSFDVDCLDPAFAPGTGTPVVGGLSTSRVLRILRGLAGLNIVGCDVVEVSPPYDPAGVTALAAATLALEFLYLQAAGG